MNLDLRPTMQKHLILISSEHPLFYSLNATYINGVYFDGMTQTHFQNDCCGIIQGTVVPGVFDCTIIGYSNPCKAFIWESEHSQLLWRGLVVDINEAGALQKAEIAYSERKQFL